MLLNIFLLIGIFILRINHKGRIITLSLLSLLMMIFLKLKLFIIQELETMCKIIRLGSPWKT